MMKRIVNTVRAFGEDLDNRVRNLSKSDFFGKIIHTYLFKIATIICYFIASILIARYLGPEKQGLYAVAITVSALGVQFGNFGLYASNLYFVAKDRTILRHLIVNSLIESCVFGGICAFIFFIIIWAFPDLIPVSGIILLLSLVWIPIKLAYLLLQHLLIGIGKITVSNRLELVYYIIWVSLITAFIIFSQLNIGFIFLFDLISLLIIIWVIFHFLKSESETPLVPSFKIFFESLHYSIKSYFANVFGFLVVRIDLLMVQYFLGLTQAGYYSIAVRIADIFCLLPATVGLLLFQKLSGVESSQEKWRFTKKTLQFVIPTVIILGAVAIFLTDYVIPLLFGHVYAEAIPATKLLILAVVLFSINTILMNYFASINLPLVTVYSPGIALIIKITLNYFLIPEFGIIGASVSSIISYAFMLCASVYYIYRANTEKGSERV